MQQVVDDPRPRQRLQVETRLAELDADALDIADAEAPPDQVVQPYTADDDLPSRLGPGQANVLERLCLDQRQRVPGSLAAGAVVPVALEPAPRNRTDRLDGRKRLRRTDVDRFDLHGRLALTPMTTV